MIQFHWECSSSQKRQVPREEVPWRFSTQWDQKTYPCIRRFTPLKFEQFAPKRKLIFQPILFQGRAVQILGVYLGYNPTKNRFFWGPHLDIALFGVHILEPSNWGPETSWDMVGQTEMVPQGRRSRNAGAVFFFLGWQGEATLQWSSKTW